MLEWLFLLLPVAAAYGWFMGSHSERQKALKGKVSVSKNLSSGLNFLLTDQEDKAIEQLLELLDIEVATIDTYLALANLFRRRGDWDKAIRIHEKLSQQKLPKPQAQKIRFELAKDYFHAGLYDRAEPILVSLVHSESIREPVLKQLFQLYLATHEWQKALEFRAVVEQTDSRSLRIMLANFQCEAWQQQKETTAHQYQQLAERYPQSLRPRYEAAKRYLQAGQGEVARPLFLSIIQERPQWAAELLPLIKSSHPSDSDWYELLNRLSVKHKNTTATQLLVEFHLNKQQKDVAENLLRDKLKQKPNIRLFQSFIKFRKEQQGDDIATELTQIEQMLHAYLETKMLYHCRNCGFKTKQTYWLCPSCKQWETVEPVPGIDGR